jgi:NIMA-interacting peptidyl-prolyl cis-trans isomerase 1
MRGACTLFLLLVSCGGSQSNASDAGEPKKKGKPEGVVCVEQARTELRPSTGAPERIDLAHITVRHAGLREAGDVTLTREEACLRALEARKKLLGGSDWDSVFKAYSDNRDETDGVIFDATQGSLEPSLADAAFSLEVDELSYPIETERGFVIVWRKK